MIQSLVDSNTKGRKFVDKINNNHEYTANEIQVLMIEAVRRRPGMYIGSTSSRVCTIWCTR